jgi:hypothetical protein
MIWAAINHIFRTELVTINGDLNAQRYVNEILKPVVQPLFNQRSGLTFQHDNARPHYVPT